MVVEPATVPRATGKRQRGNGNTPRTMSCDQRVTKPTRSMPETTVAWT
jgi:hypothetical protein